MSGSVPSGWFFDANLIPIGKALMHVRPDVWYPGGPGCPVTHPRMPDDEWLPIVGERGWAVLTRDKKIRKRPGELRALRDAGVQAFSLTGAGQKPRWAILELIVRQWDAMERACQDQPGPFLYAVTAGGLRQIQVD
jgi:hypothetical protein